MRKIIWVLIPALVIGFSCKKKETPPAEPKTEEPTLRAEPSSQTMPRAEEAEAPEESWSFEMGVIREDGNSITVLKYVEGKNRRVDQYEGVGRNKKIKRISISTSEGTWVLNSEDKTGTKMPPEEETHRLYEGPPAMAKWEEVLNTASKASGIKISEPRSEEWEGMILKVYRLTHLGNKNYLDYFVDDQGLVRRVVSYDETGKMVEDARMNLQIGPLPKDTFQPPPGYQIQEINKME